MIILIAAILLVALAWGLVARGLRFTFCELCRWLGIARQRIRGANFSRAYWIRGPPARLVSLALLLSLVVGAAANATLIHAFPQTSGAASTVVDNTIGPDGTYGGGDNVDAKLVKIAVAELLYGLDYNGTDDYTDISAAAVSFADGAAFTFEAVFDADTLATSLPVVGISGSTASRILVQSTTNIRLGAGTNFTVATITTNEPHHLFVTRAATSNNCRVWVDGVESSSGTQVHSGAFAPLRMGHASTTFGNGRLSDVRIYDSDESANVATRYAAYTFSRKWPLNDDAASTVVTGSIGANAALVGGKDTEDTATFGPGLSLTAAQRFDGANDYINLASTDALYLTWNASTGPFSFGCWFMPLSKRNLIDESIAGGSSSQACEIIDPETIRIRTASGNADFTVSTMKPGRWYYVFFTRNASNAWNLWHGEAGGSVAASASNPITLAGNAAFSTLGRQGTTEAYIKVANAQVWRGDYSANVATYFAEAGAQPTLGDPLISSLRFTQAASNNSLDNRTVTGAGITQAVFAFGNNATSDGTPIDHGEYGYGIGINEATGKDDNGFVGQVGYGNYIGHNLTTATDGHRASPDVVYQSLADGDITPAKRSAFSIYERITDGFQAKQNLAAGTPPLTDAVVFSGDWEKDLFVKALATVEDEYVEQTLDFDADGLIVLFNGDPPDDGGHPGFGVLAITFITFDDEGTPSYASGSWSYDKDDSQNANCLGIISNTAIRLWDPNHIGVVWEITVSKPSTNVLRFTTATYGEDDGEITVYAFKSALACQAGFLSITNSASTYTPSASPSIGFTPNTMFMLPNFLTAQNTGTDTGAAGSSGISVITRPGLGGAGDGDWSVSQQNEDNVSPTDTQSVNDNQAVNLPAHDGGTGIAATFSSFVSGGISLNVSSAPSGTVLWPFLAFGEPPAAKPHLYYYMNRQPKILRDSPFAIAP